MSMDHIKVLYLKLMKIYTFKIYKKKNGEENTLSLRIKLEVKNKNFIMSVAF